MVFNAGHDAHMKLLQQEASGEELPFRIILLHAEDQLMSAEASVSLPSASSRSINAWVQAPN